MRKILTIREFAETIAKNLDMLKEEDTSFDFGFLDETARDIEEARLNVEGWFGVSIIKTVFDSPDTHLIVDYWGGGATHLVVVTQGDENDEYVVDEIEKAIKNAFNAIEGIYPPSEQKLYVEYCKKL